MITDEIAATASKSAMSLSESSPSKKAYFVPGFLDAEDMTASGPSGCTKDNTAWTPLFVRTHEPSNGDVAVALVLFVLVYYVIVTQAVQSTSVIGFCIPVSGLLIGLKSFDRLFQLPATAFFLFVAGASTNVKFLKFYGIYIVAGIALVAAGLDCNHVSFVILDGITILFCVLYIYLETVTLSLPRLFAAGELLVCVLILVTDLRLVSERERHLTWWGIVAYGVYVWARARDQQDSVWLTTFLLHVVIISGVWFMSISKCDLLSDALDEAGPILYLVGNFILHYYPFLRILAYKPKSLKQPLRQVVVAIAIIVAYTSTTDAQKVYGCQSWLKPVVVVSSFTGVILVSFSLLLWFGSWVLFPDKQ